MSTNPNIRETRSMMDAVDLYCSYDELLQFLNHLERASARQVLDKLDQLIEPGEERQAIRRRLLDTLAWYKAEILRWVESESNSAVEPTGPPSSKTPLTASG